MDITKQQQAIIELQHERARRIRKQGGANWQNYERIKNVLRGIKLSPDEYEREAQTIAKEMGL